jgi:chemotaxis methyl-accepting protein methylase
MINTGIWKASQIASLRENRSLVETKRISITLYNDLVDRDDDLAETLLCYYSDSRGVYKRTYRNRFQQFDEKIIGHLKAAFDTAHPLKIHDVGVSDGRTAVDLFNCLAEQFSQIEYVASDFESELNVHRDGDASVTVSKSGTISEIVYPPFVFNLWKSDSARLHPINRLALLLAKLRAKRILNKAKDTRHEPIKLFCPNAARLALNDNRFRIADHNILDPMSGQFHAIRAMNILNVSYFSEAQIDKIARNFHNGLRDGGLLFFGSNEGPGTPVRGGIFRKAANRYDVLDSAIEPLEATESFKSFRL